MQDNSGHLLRARINRPIIPQHTAIVKSVFDVDLCLDIHVFNFF